MNSMSIVRYFRVVRDLNAPQEMLECRSSEEFWAIYVSHVRLYSRSERSDGGRLDFGVCSGLFAIGVPYLCPGKGST